MGTQIFPAGTTATYAVYSGGTPGSATAISMLKKISSSKVEAKMGNLQGLSDTAVKEYPSGVTDPGEVQITVFLDNTTVASNFLTTVAGWVSAKSKLQIKINLPDAVDDTNPLVGPYNGYVKEYENPELESKDEPIEFTFTLRNSTA